jgi:hypothetical protein
MRSPEENIGQTGGQSRAYRPRARQRPNGPDDNPPSGQTGRILSGKDFLATFHPADYVVDGIIQRGRLYACTSITSHGKTAVFLTIACMVAAHRYLGTIETSGGGVVILAGENADDLCGRMHAMVQEFHLDPAKLPHVLPLQFPLTDEEAEILNAEIDAIPGDKALIVGDTAPAYSPVLEENDNIQMGNYGRIQRSLITCRGRPAVVFLTHPVKNATRDNLLPRGGGAYLNELDGNLILWSEALGESTTLHWQKLRGADFAPVTFALQQVTLEHLRDAKGRPTVTIVAIPQSQEAADNAFAQALSDQNAVLYWLRERPGIAIRAVAREAGWVNDRDIPNTAKVHRCLRVLKREKLVRQQRGKWVITEAGKDELRGQREGDRC